MQEVCVSQIYSLIDKNLFFDLCFYQNCDYVQASCDTFYHHQNNSAELASTLSDEEKISVKKLTEQFFNQHHYFSKVWLYLNSTKKKKKSFGLCIREKRPHTLGDNYQHGIVFF